LIQQQGRWFDLDLDQPKSKILSLLNDVEQIDFYGGEPFLVRGFERIIDYLIDSDREKHIRIHVNTNGSIFPNDSLLKKLKKFQSIDIGLSIDDIGERFELIRGGNWEKIFKNIKSYQQLVDERFGIHIYITVSVLNVYYLDHIVDLSQSLGIKTLFNFVNYPEYLSIDQLTPEAKNLVLDKYRFQTKKLDSFRSQDFRKTHREIATAMGYT
jgi:MoaA/NifB/PqqE/SkfB family radical SAM enzyme